MRELLRADLRRVFAGPLFYGALALSVALTAFRVAYAARTPDDRFLPLYPYALR